MGSVRWCRRIALYVIVYVVSTIFIRVNSHPQKPHCMQNVRFFSTYPMQFLAFGHCFSRIQGSCTLFALLFFSCWHNLSKYIVCEFWLVSRKHFYVHFARISCVPKRPAFIRAIQYGIQSQFRILMNTSLQTIDIRYTIFCWVFFGFSPNISIQFKFQILFIIYTTNFGTKLLKLNQF